MNIQRVLNAKGAKGAKFRKGLFFAILSTLRDFALNVQFIFASLRRETDEI